ncbi:ABC-type branched-subunit amino acid transport system substrate-binding protein [Streptomyces sp. SLBN-118]|nr:ABC-type branched-subunit amino acid transport system substrate-binding protein [Streptomyces sp. SLBN-118]
MVGTPGYLSPEQAEGRGGQAIGPASDVFSLGCVLAFAATGRPPFGTGALDALLYRAVHDPADLDGVPPALGEVVSRCLEKDPAQRPGVEELVRELLPGHPAGEPADAPARGLTQNGPNRGPADGAAKAVSGAASWLPEGVTRLIARRSAAALALPDIDSTEISAGTSRTESSPGKTPGAGTDLRMPTPNRHRSAPTTTTRCRRSRTAPGLPDGAASFCSPVGARCSRRRRARAGGAWAGTAALAKGSPPLPGAPPTPSRCTATSAAPGARRGRLRSADWGWHVAEFNARGDAPFDVKVRAVDDSGDPAVAARLAKQLADDPSVLAAYDAGLLPVVAVSPVAINLSVQGFRSFLHARLPDSLLPFFMSAYLRGTAHSRRIGVVVDRAADNYGWELSSNLSRVLRDERQPYLPRVVGAMRSGFGDAVDDLLAADADSIAFAGLHDRAASLARTLRQREFSGARASGPDLLDSRFLNLAKEAADGWTIVAPVVDATLKPEAKAFADVYRKRWNEAPPRYAAEAYDVTGMVLKALANLPAKSRTRKELLAAVRAIKYQGVTKPFAFDKIGHMVIDGTGVFLWRVEKGRFVYGGPAPHTA